MRKQSESDQVKRLENVSCPVHGVPLSQVPSGLESARFTLASCTRQKCGITAVVDHFVLEGGAVEVHVRQLISAEQLDQLNELERDILGRARDQAAREIDAALSKMLSEPDIQPR